MTIEFTENLCQQKQTAQWSLQLPGSAATCGLRRTHLRPRLNRAVLAALILCVPRIATFPYSLGLVLSTNSYQAAESVPDGDFILPCCPTHAITGKHARICRERRGRRRPGGWWSWLTRFCAIASSCSGLSGFRLPELPVIGIPGAGLPGGDEPVGGRPGFWWDGAVSSTGELTVLADRLRRDRRRDPRAGRREYSRGRCCVGRSWRLVGWLHLVRARSSLASGSRAR